MELILRACVDGWRLMNFGQVQIRSAGGLAWHISRVRVPLARRGFDFTSSTRQINSGGLN